jgi:hypothetical protein
MRLTRIGEVPIRTVTHFVSFESSQNRNLESMVRMQMTPNIQQMTYFVCQAKVRPLPHQISFGIHSIEAQRFVEHRQGFLPDRMASEAKVCRRPECEVSDQKFCDCDDEFHWQSRISLVLANRVSEGDSSIEQRENYSQRHRE